MEHANFALSALRHIDDIPASDLKFLDQLVRFLHYNDCAIGIGKAKTIKTVQGLAYLLGINADLCYKRTRSLIKNEILIKTHEKGYMINPYVVWKGEMPPALELELFKGTKWYEYIFEKGEI